MDLINIINWLSNASLFFPWVVLTIIVYELLLVE